MTLHLDTIRRHEGMTAADFQRARVGLVQEASARGIRLQVDPVRAGLWFRLDEDATRAVAEDRTARMLRWIYITLTVATVLLGVALGAMATALWTMQIETLLTTPRVLY